MPHRILWTISHTADVDAEHRLQIQLDTDQIKRQILTPPHNLTISFPSGPTFTAFETVWENSTPNFPGLRQDWGYESDPVSKARWYRISVPHIMADMPQWDQKSTIELAVNTRQPGAWTVTGRGSEFALEDVRISPPVDGELRVIVPKPIGRWARFCERLVFHLKLGQAHMIGARRFPSVYQADDPIIDERACTVRFCFSSARQVELRTIRVTYSRGMVYGWLTSKKAILVVFALLVALGSVVYTFFQIISLLV